MLKTELNHIENEKKFNEILEANENVMICCGRMGPMCIPVYKVMSELSPEYSNVSFCDMDFDSPVADSIKNLPECHGFMGLPFTVYFKNGKAVAVTTSIQSKAQVKEHLDTHLS